MLNRDSILKEAKIIAAALSIGLALAVCVAAYTYVYSDTTQRNIADNVIRFHVLAHGNEPAEQALKEYVRLQIFSEFKDTPVGHNIEEVRMLLSNQLPAMESLAQSLVHEAGFDHPVSAAISTAFFPTQAYGDMIFPPGKYEAVQIVIGDGAGNNWWCLMFPPLCYVEMTSTEAGRRQLSETVSADGFRLLTHREESRDIQVRFRIVEWWQNRRQPTAPTYPVRQTALYE